MKQHPTRKIRSARVTVAAALLLLAALGGGAAAEAAGLDAPDGSIPANLAAVTAALEPAVARPGEHVRLIVTVRVADGWYTYSATPQPDEFAPPPTTLRVEPGPLQPEGAVYETEPHRKQDDTVGLTLAVHPHAARFYQNLYVPEDAAPASMRIAGTLTYQVCNNRICTPPREQDIGAGLTIEPGPVRPAYAQMQRTVDRLDDAGAVQVTGESLREVLAGGAGSFLLLAAGFGLLALLTPCVFPMIPVTVSFFTSVGVGRNALKLVLLFGAGIVGSYTGLGLALSALLGASGIGQFASNPWVNLVVAGFFIVFALSLLGIYELALPATWAQALDARARSLKGPLGVLLMGTTFTVTSFTCTMPFVGTLLLASLQEQSFLPVAGMVVYATVFATPFVLLALFPRLLTRMRGAGGPWLVQVKIVLGLVELMAALKFVSNSDLVWQWGFFDRELLLALWAGLAAAAVLVVLRLLPGARSGRIVRRVPQWIVGGAFAGLAAYFGLGLAGAELDSYTESYLPPPLRVGAQTQDGGEPGPLAGREDLVWYDSLEQGLRQAAATGQGVLVDFTGYTCVNCRWMERKVFAQQAIQEALQSRFVRVRLYTDGGEQAEENQKLQIERFQTIALPFYAILAPDNVVLARHAGIASSVEFLGFLSDGERMLSTLTPLEPVVLPAPLAQRPVAAGGGS